MYIVVNSPKTPIATKDCRFSCGRSNLGQRDCGFDDIAQLDGFGLFFCDGPNLPDRIRVVLGL